MVTDSICYRDPARGQWQAVDEAGVRGVVGRERGKMYPDRRVNEFQKEMCD